MFGWFNKQNLVDEQSAQWLLDAFAWSLRNFDAEIFFQETRLVIPTDEYFPGRENSAEGMARLILEHVKRHAGMQHWPMHLQNQSACSVSPSHQLEIKGALRTFEASPLAAVNQHNGLTVAYDPELVGNPEALIASYAHTLAHHLGRMAQEPPPGGAAYWPQATEVLAIFLGFGLMFANSAFNVAIRSCGSCGGSAAARESYLTQYESTYCLALFCVLKEISNPTVLRHLKKSLRPFYRKCIKEIRDNQDDLSRLKKVSTEPVRKTENSPGLPSWSVTLPQ